MRFITKSISWIKERYSKKETLHSQPKKQLPLLVLTPVRIEKGDPHYEIVSELIDALKDDRVRNIGVTGPYGSGKSSILETLKSENSHHYKCLSISLAALGAYPQATDNKLLSTDEIEFCLLQQLIYTERATRLRNSRFSRIKHLSRWSMIQPVLLLLLILIPILLLFKPSWLCNLNIAQVLDWKRINLWVELVALLCLLSALIWVIALSTRILCSFKASRISLQGNSIEFEKGVSVFSKHLDEILYFFRVTKYDVVLIEDLDRFENPDLFVKLRELNKLLNAAKEINRKIAFIYAVRDDLLKGTIKTKFFDYIISVVPVVNIGNASDKLLCTLTEKGYDKISEEDIHDIGSYLDDMRQLFNIVNEYGQYQKQLSGPNATLSHEKLLAIVVYKNLYPEDFYSLHKGEGVIYKCLSAREKFIEALEKQIHEDIDNSCPDEPEKSAQAQSQLKAIRSKKIRDLINEIECPEKIPEYQEIKKNPMLDLFVQRGYIDEDYQDYTNFFYEGALTHKDRNLLLEMKTGKSRDFTTSIDKVDNFISKMPEYLFTYQSIENNSLINALVENRAKYPKKYMQLEKYLQSSKASLEFLAQYYRVGKSISVVFENYCRGEELQKKWDAIVRADSKLVNTLAEAWLKYRQLKNSDDLFEEEIEWLNQNFPFVSKRFEEFEEKQVSAIIERCEFFGLEHNSPEALLREVLKKHCYVLTPENLSLLINFLKSDDLTTPDNLNLSRLLDSENEDLISYVCQNLEKCIQSFVSKATKEEEEKGLLRIINSDINEQIKVDYLSGQRATIQNLSDVSGENKTVALQCELIEANWRNISIYDSASDEVDKHRHLIAYVNRFAKKIAASPFEWEGEPESLNKFHVSLLTKNDLEIESYKAIAPCFGNSPLDNCSLEQLEENRLVFLLENGLLAYSECMKSEIEKRGSPVLALYLEKNPKYLDENCNEISFDEDLALKLLSSELLTPELKSKIIKCCDSDLAANNKKLSDLIYHLYGTGEVEVEKQILLAILKETVDIPSVLKTIIRLLKLNAISEKELSGMLENLPCPYNKILSESIVFGEQEEDYTLMLILQKKGYICSTSLHNRTKRTKKRAEHLSSN